MEVNMEIYELIEYYNQKNQKINELWRLL